MSRSKGRPITKDEIQRIGVGNVVRSRDVVNSGVTETFLQTFTVQREFGITSMRSSADVPSFSYPAFERAS